MNPFRVPDTDSWGFLIQYLMLKLVGKPHILLPILVLFGEFHFLTVWLYYHIKACLSFPILSLILGRMLNLWPLLNGVEWCLRQNVFILLQLGK